MLPVKVQDQVAAILVVVRSADREFDRNTAAMLEALADFAAISLVHDRLLKAVEGAETAARRNEQAHRASLESLRASIRDEYRVSLHPLENVLAARIACVDQRAAAGSPHRPECIGALGAFGGDGLPRANRQRRTDPRFDA